MRFRGAMYDGYLTRWTMHHVRSYTRVDWHFYPGQKGRENDLPRDLDDDVVSSVARPMNDAVIA